MLKKKSSSNDAAWERRRRQKWEEVLQNAAVLAHAHVSIWPNARTSTQTWHVGGVRIFGVLVYRSLYFLLSVCAIVIFLFSILM